MSRTLGLMLLASTALAQTSSTQTSATRTPGNRTYVGEDVFVASGQQIHNATCIFCSVQVEGDLTGRVLVIFGNLNVSGRVRQNATIIGGNAVIDSQARIGGNAVVLGGNAVYETDESISGSAWVLGGHLSRTGDRSAAHKRVSLNPFLFFSMAILAVLLLSLLIFPYIRRQHPVRPAH